MLVLVLRVTQGQVDIIKIDIDSYVPRPGQLPFDPHDPPKPPNGDTERAWEGEGVMGAARTEIKFDD